MITTYSDGGSRGNPGPAAIGVVLYKDGKEIKNYKEYIGETTNNQAEYLAINKALELASKEGEKIKCYLDSQLVVRQLNGQYRVKNEGLRELYMELKRKEKEFEEVEYIHVMRENEGMQKADKLVNEALDEKDPKA